MSKEHGHHHNEHCECGHEHEHEHQHHHEEHCGCGHDHHEDHHHRRDEDCGCHSEGCHCGENLAIRHEEEEKNELPMIVTGAVIFAAGMMTGHFLELTIPSIILYVIAYLILGGEIILKSVKGILRGDIFDENFLMSIATIGAFAIQEYPEAVGVMLFYRIGEWFEDKAVEKSRGQIMDAIDMRPETVTLVNGEDKKEVPAAEAKVGEWMLVRPGERIPLDGIVVEGESRIDTSPVTGEPVPVGASEGTAVLSGCVNVSGLLKLEITNTAMLNGTPRKVSALRW